MKIEKIKHRLLIDDIWETLILENNEPRVYVKKNSLYTKNDWELERDTDIPVSEKNKKKIDDIFNKDWSNYK